MLCMSAATAGHRNSLPTETPFSLLPLQEPFPDDSVSCIIPFSRVGNLILIKAKADTTEGNFILDTGAPGLVLNITYFRDYPATTEINDEQRGITGSVEAVKKTEVKDFSFDCVHAGVVPADLVNLGHIENTKGVKIVGLIGLSVFRRFEMIVDYENNLLHLHRIGKKEASVYKNTMLIDEAAYSVVPIEIWNNKIVTRTSLSGKKLRLIIDSGAESNVLDSRLPNKIFDNVEIIKRIQLAGAGQKKVDALYGNLNNLEIGGRSVSSLPVIITNLEKTCLADNSCIDGILGFDFLSLHKIGFNFVNNKMYIWK